MGTSNGKLTASVASLGNLQGASEVQVVSQTAGQDLSGDLVGFRFGSQQVTTSGTTLTFKNSKNFTSISASNVALQRATNYSDIPNFINAFVPKWIVVVKSKKEYKPVVDVDSKLSKNNKKPARELTKRGSLRCARRSTTMSRTCMPAGCFLSRHG